MDDLISKQAAIDAISCNITVTGRQNAELVAATIGTFADRIKALPSAQQKCIDAEDLLEFLNFIRKKQVEQADEMTKQRKMVKASKHHAIIDFIDLMMDYIRENMEES